VLAISYTATLYEMPTLSVVQVRLFVCQLVCLFLSLLFVCSITQKQMIPKCSKLVQGLTIGYPRSDMILGVSRSQVRVRVRVKVQQYSMGSNSMSDF